MFNQFANESILLHQEPESSRVAAVDLVALNQQLIAESVPAGKCWAGGGRIGNIIQVATCQGGEVQRCKALRQKCERLDGVVRSAAAKPFCGSKDRRSLDKGNREVNQHLSPNRIGNGAGVGGESPWQLQLKSVDAHLLTNRLHFRGAARTLPSSVALHQ